ncbi:hypothetical protein [Micromonospora sp.]|uniref:hypothetical protein n=1 Tax=Micromonospora sp. TaxID=1876 RepID=UPI003B3B3808
MTLIALEVLGSGKGPEQGGKLLVWLTGGVRRAFDPEVAGIPRVGKPTPAAGGKGKSSGGGLGEIGGTLPRNPIVTT